MKYPSKPYYCDYSTDEDYEKALEDWEYICDMIDLEADGKRDER